MNEQLRAQFEAWHEQDEHQKIVDAVLALPPEERGYEETGQLARAYNNLGELEAALELLLSIAEQGRGDFRWHYRVGYSYFYLHQNERAAAAFDRAVALNPEDAHSWFFVALVSRTLGNRGRFELAKERVQALDPELFEQEFPPDQEESYCPEQYTQEAFDAVEAHIRQYFGVYPLVFHEKLSPDIHVDICLIEPTPERDYYTLVTLGMGAHRMNVPEELRDSRLDRAELLICLPARWNIRGQAEKWYWPLRWLKILARLPGSEDTWLGWGHTVPKGAPFSYNTNLSSVILTEPALFDAEAAVCHLPDGDAINFYQVVPIYQNELDCKLHRGAKSLLRLFGQDAYVVDIDRPSVCRNWKLEPEDDLPDPQIEPAVPRWDGPAGCLATRKITREKLPVGYFYREAPVEGAPDSGWRFLEGNEDESYMSDPANTEVCHLDTICASNPGIAPLLTSPQGTAYFRGEDGRFYYEEPMEG